MSFSLTTPQMRARSKTVTRRTGWTFLKPGDRILAVEKTRGLKKGEKQKPIGVIEVLRVHQVPLFPITIEELALEGFADMAPIEFVRSFQKYARIQPWEDVTRIEFRHVEEGT